MSKGSSMPAVDIIIRDMLTEDWPEVAGIYAEGIATGDATFEQTVPEWQVWDQHHLDFARCVAVVTDEILGWAALTPVSDRCAYYGVAEVSVYVSQKARGEGIGRKLLERLIALSEQNGIWTLQAGIFPENQVSVALHESCGFRLVGKRERLGILNGKWRDVLLLERRSSVTGL
jgi:L-amino acid N-acyltransferase YncA